MCRLLVPQVITTHLRDHVRGIFLDLRRTFWVFLPPIPQFMVSLLKFSYQTLLCLIKPATVECPMTAVDVLLFASRSATCLSCFSSIPFFIKSSSRVDGSQKKGCYFVIVKYSYQCLNILMVVPEHNNLQVMVLKCFCYFREDL